MNNDRDRADAIERAQRGLNAALDNTEAAMEVCDKTMTRLLTSLSEVTNELRNNYMTQSLGGPSRAVENAELLARAQQLRVDVAAALRTRSSNIEANHQLFNNSMAELMQAVSPDA